MWIVRGGMVEPAVGAGARRAVVELLHPGDVDGDVELLLGKSLPAQVARMLTEEAIDGRVGLPQRTLAAMLGVQRPSLNKVLKQFERQRLVAVGYGEIRVLDPQGLTRLTR